MPAVTSRSSAPPADLPTMRVDACSVAAPGQSDNEDHILQYGDLVGVLDGATAPAGFDTGCSHGPAWYVRRLAARLGLASAATPAAPLAGLLAEAIRAVRDDHAASCDVDHPGTPSATVCLLRRSGGHLDYLVLCDSPLVFEAAGQVGVVSDNRLADTMDRLRGQHDPPATDDPRHRYHRAVRWQRQWMNQPDGYWVAAADPAAADRALCGTLPLTGPGRITRAALLSDGATRAVERFGRYSWPQLMDLLAEAGPAELIRQVRTAETAEPDRSIGHKRHDDATAIFCLFDTG
ncbi:MULTISPECIES: protein phosphatase 2C domain-containing protein [unclassified Solwaraspora]|uniref:protein phosphatase 2C domain-containing protein n=1 Tax=unclassified Solwaraspora TaxID=2627926 RepID=UPI00248D1D3B|nr:MULTISPECIES: protein phosphatase 2C domain-containing protein [unclassified Solwaraspora]WBC00536.1 protein phosphatase 2C domain-containing protein [Solwaraspora sp. WMMA2059]WBC23852.1 protein phosphatase 2C domain-containing protein [Solwaraspora sp. WMMA2080]WJK37932.1 protein phosphatase 2C domain-containing protein [Solwaraspora sp. WMMA2065]